LKNKIPRQGWLYLSVEYLCFYSYLLGIEDKIIVRWTDVINLDKNTGMLTGTIKVITRDKRKVSKKCFFFYRNLNLTINTFGHKTKMYSIFIFIVIYVILT